MPFHLAIIGLFMPTNGADFIIRAIEKTEIKNSACGKKIQRVLN